MITGSGFFVLLFLGGWDLPIVQEPAVGGIFLVLLKASVFIAKIAVLLFVMMWVRWTLPRLRFDQLMRLAWRGLIPICVLALVGTGLLVYYGLPAWSMLVLNIVLFAGVVFIGPRMPQADNPNRRIQLHGSRFNPPTAA